MGFAATMHEQRHVTHIPAGQAGTTHYLTEQRNVSGFSCTCAAGYTGDICQTRLPCLGDADGNFVINVEDVLIVLSNFGKTPATGMNPAADVATFPVSTAGLINVEDVLIVLARFGDTC